MTKPPVSKMPKAGARSKSASKPALHAETQTLWAASSVLVISKGEAVAHAVAEQLTAEGHWPPQDFNRVMNSDYGYDVRTLGNFLFGVHSRLENGSPSYAFQFDVNFVKAALGKSVTGLTGAIYSKTV